MKDVSGRNGSSPNKLRSNVAIKRAVTLSALCAASLLAGCATMGTSTTATGRKAQCAAWRAITYSAGKDTSETVGQVREHNQTGRNLKCWK